MEIKCPHQCFINNEFVDSTGGKFFNTVNPTDESIICSVSSSQHEDVLKAVKAAKVDIMEGGEGGGGEGGGGEGEGGEEGGGRRGEGGRGGREGGERGGREERGVGGRRGGERE